LAGPFPSEGTAKVRIRQMAARQRSGLDGPCHFRNGIGISLPACFQDDEANDDGSNCKKAGKYDAEELERIAERAASLEALWRAAPRLQFGIDKVNSLLNPMCELLVLPDPNGAHGRIEPELPVTCQP